MSRAWPSALILLTLAPATPRADEPPPAVTARLVRPELQGQEVLALFQGARVPHPAAALAAWKRATRESLGKPREAVISLFNPAMMAEMKVLDGASLALAFDPGNGGLRWRALPHDDGTFAALATATALTDGGAEAPLGGAAVDRLGPPGSPLMARAAGLVALAASRQDLQAALQSPRTPDDGGIGSGLLIEIRPEGLGKLGPLSRRRAAEALRALAADATGVLRVEGRAIRADWTTRLEFPATAAAIDPRWLHAVPASAAAVVAFALDPSPEGWDRAFAVADRVEHVDPARAGVAPLRARLNLIAMAAKVRPEADLWPALRGVSAGVLADPTGEISGAIVALHVVDPAAAERLEKQVLPRLIAPFAKGGRLANRPLQFASRGSAVVIGWGESALEASLAAIDHPERSIAGLVRPGWGPTLPARAGAFWPGRLRITAPAGSPWELAMKGAAPVVWQGRNEGKIARDAVRWTELDGVVRRFLERLPLDPPPDRAEK